MCFNWAEKPHAATTQASLSIPRPAASGSSTEAAFSGAPAGPREQSQAEPQPQPESQPEAQVSTQRRRPGRPKRPAGAPPSRRADPHPEKSKPLIVEAPAPYLPSGPVRRLAPAPASVQTAISASASRSLPQPRRAPRAPDGINLAPLMEVRHLLKPAERDVIEALATHSLSLPAIARLTGRDPRRLRRAVAALAARVGAPLFRFVLQTRHGSTCPHPTVRLGPGLSAIAEAIVFRGLSQRQAACERRITLHQVRRARDLLIRLFVAHLDEPGSQRITDAPAAPSQPPHPPSPHAPGLPHLRAIPAQPSAQPQRGVADVPLPCPSPASEFAKSRGVH